MQKILIFGNSASGKSTLASALSEQRGLAHLDLDSLAWEAPESPDATPIRRDLLASIEDMNAFDSRHDQWVIEGCYADLLEAMCAYASDLIYLKLPIEQCVRNAQKRPWEPHKYVSKDAQDANLAMLIDWIRQYETREDTFSEAAHQALFDDFQGQKHMLTTAVSASELSL